VKKVSIIDVGFNEVNFAKGAEDWICYIEWGDRRCSGSIIYTRMKIAEIVKMSTNGVCMKILVAFLRGNIFEPKAGNEVRIHNLAKQLAKENEIVTLESKEYRGTNVSFPVKARYFVNPFAIKKFILELFLQI